MKDIVDGNVDLDQLAKDEEEEAKMVQARENLKVREKQEFLLKGRPGKGHQKGYKRFCRSCFTEYMIEIEKCTHCGKDTMTEEVGSRTFLKLYRSVTMSLRISWRSTR